MFAPPIFNHLVIVTAEWPGGGVVTAIDLRSNGCKFDRLLVGPLSGNHLGQVVHTHVTEQYK